MHLIRNAEALQVCVDVFASAMDEHERFAAFPRFGDSAKNVRAPRRIFEEASSELDDPHARPSVSGNPHIRLKFCTACEAAPFSRLSITETITARRPPCSSVKPISQRGVLTTFLSSGNCPAGRMRTNGAASYARA